MPQHFTCICSTDETTGKVHRRVEKSGAFHDEYTYSYDEAGHLKEVFRNDMLRESYTYNGKGQRTLRLNGWDDGAVRYKYDDNGCLLAMICNSSRLFDYDENGNLIRSRELVFQQPDKETKYFYQDTLLKDVLLPDGTELVYVYDERGKNTVCPVAKYKNGRPVMQLVWKDIRFLESCVDVERGIRFDFTYKNGKLATVHLSRAGMEKMRLGDFGNGPDILSRLGGDGTLLAFCDQVGTPKLFTNKAGRHIKEMSCDSFGILDDDSLPELFIPIGFAGGLVDEDTGLVRFGFRDYYPAIGRFTCPDPIGDTGGDHDLYDYCVDDPVSKFDPLGLFGMGGFTKQQGLKEKSTLPDVFDDNQTPAGMRKINRELDAVNALGTPQFEQEVRNAEQKKYGKHGNNSFARNVYGVSSDKELAELGYESPPRVSLDDVRKHPDYHPDAESLHNEYWTPERADMTLKKFKREKRLRKLAEGSPVTKGEMVLDYVKNAPRYFIEDMQDSRNLAGAVAGRGASQAAKGLGAAGKFMFGQGTGKAVTEGVKEGDRRAKEKKTDGNTK